MGLKRTEKNTGLERSVSTFQQENVSDNSTYTLGTLTVLLQDHFAQERSSLLQMYKIEFHRIYRIC